MSEAKHTPEYRVTGDGRVFSLSSNWRGYGQRELEIVMDDSEGVNPLIAIVDCGNVSDEAQSLADARLIAAAPELYEAATKALEIISEQRWPTVATLLRAAIFKAEGRAS